MAQTLSYLCCWGIGFIIIIIIIIIIILLCVDLLEDTYSMASKDSWQQFPEAFIVLLYWPLLR